MPTLKFTGVDTNTTYKSMPFDKGMDWLIKQRIIGLDTETNVVKSILQRELKVISIADEIGDFVWVVDWEFLTDLQKFELLSCIKTKLSIVHGLTFDYAIIKKYGTILEKIWCTYLAEQTLTTGYSSESGFHGLQAVFRRRFDIDISKAEQLTFGDGIPFTDEQIRYAAVDVLKLGDLRKLQHLEMKAHDKRIGQPHHKGMMKSAWWDMEFAKVAADMEMEGVRIDKDKWYAIEDAVRPIYEAELLALNDLVKEHYWDILEDNNWVSDKDELVVNVWSSSVMKTKVLSRIYDFEIIKTAKTELKKLLQLHDPNFPEGLKLSGKSWNESEYPVSFTDNFAILKLIILDGKDFDSKPHLDKVLLTNMREFCISQGWLREANKVSLNWGAWQQRLVIFQAINPAIQSTGKDIIVDYIDESPVIAHYLEWSRVNHQITSFGRNFYDKNVEVDGKFRTRFNIILATGRLSSVEPNMLNIPRKVPVYREAIIPDPGYDLLDADYDGQELVITTALSKEPSWTEYLKRGYDLHSKNAELIFGDEWKNATEEGCAYYRRDKIRAGAPTEYKKCKCKGHVEMRDNSKAVSFGKEKMRIFAPNQRCYV